MSRSYKKNCGGKITTTSSDKVDKKIWHRTVRTATHNWENQMQDVSDYDDAPEPPGLYDSPRSDTWSWNSDGGSFLQETDESIIKMLNDVYNYPEEAIAAFNPKWASNWDMIAVISKFIKIESAVQLRDFLSKKENFEKVIKLWKKLNYGK
jgi:hypothetical protein